MNDVHRLTAPVQAKLVRSAQLTFCEVRQYRDDYLWTWTQFPDGSGYGATPDHSDGGRAGYADLARRMGCGSVDEYCFVHEFTHSFIAQEVSGGPSPVLWALAHKRRHPDHTVYEEALVLNFQGFLHGGVPMAAVAPDIDWWALRAKALRLLALADDPTRDPAATAALR